MYKSLPNELRRINQQFDNPILLANPYFRLTKPTPENLEKYKNYNLGHVKLRTFLNFLGLIPFAFIQGVWNVLLSLLTPWEWFPWQKFSESNYHFLGISQVTRSNQEFENDPSLGEIPQLIGSDKSLCMLYLNGTRLFRRNVKASLINRKHREVVVNSKTLSPVATINLVLLNIYTTTTFILRVIRENLSSERDLYLISEGTLFQFRRATFANLILLRRLSDILKNVSLRTVFFTLEGHAHEAMIMGLIKTRFPHLQIIVIQHAPIVPSQFGYFDNLLLLRSLDSVLCTGTITQEITRIFLQDSGGACSDVGIVGSLKGKLPVKDYSDSLNVKNKSILLLPEGTKSSAIEFLRLLHYMASRHPNWDFVYRLHPATRKNAKLMSLIAQELPRNAIVSSQSLTQDLEISTYSIYRSSAAAIEALAFGVIPIHFDPSSFFSLDPILNEKLQHPKTQNYAQLEAIIEDLIDPPLPPSSDTRVIREYFRDYYFPLDITALTKRQSC